MLPGAQRRAVNVGDNAVQSRWSSPMTPCFPRPMVARTYEQELPSAIALLDLLLATAPHAAAEPAPTCRHGDGGRLIRYEKVASYPTPASARAYFDEWIAFYQDFYPFPASLPETFEFGFDSYKVTY